MTDVMERTGDTPTNVIGWVERAQAGDAEAFGLLYERYVDTVFKFVYYRTHSDRPLAEDLTSETFTRALRRIGTFTWQGRDVGAWLITIARNIVADYYKSGWRRIEVVVDHRDLLADREDKSRDGRPVESAIGNIANEALFAALGQLSSKQRTCIELRFLHGFTVAETAAAMGRQEGAIKALQYRAIRALGRLLPEGFEY